MTTFTSQFKVALILFIATFFSSGLIAQADPTSLITATLAADQIELTFQDNAAGDDIMIAYSTTGSFGTPSNGTPYSIGNTIGDGEVIFNGAEGGGNIAHTSLTANTQYYYKAWSVDGSSNYSPGITDNATTAKWEPTYHPTNFDTTSVAYNSITLEWSDATGTVLPDAYLIKGSTVSLGDIIDPVDGTAESNSSLIQNVNYGVESHTFSSLSANTDYYFKIYSYTNNGTLIDYKTIGTIVNLSTTTDLAPLTVSILGTATEGSESTASVSVTLTNDEFAASLTPSNWTLNNLPTGVSKGLIVRDNNTTATINLSGNRTVDYDNDITNLEVIIQGAEFVDHSGTHSDNSGFTFNANDDPETINIADGINGITEGAESGEEITVTLSGGTFANPLNSANWSLTNNPTGVSIGSINRDNATTATITLSGDRTTDYDSDITNLVVTANASEIDDRSSSLASDGTGATFSANDESVSIAHDGTGLTEANLSTATIDISLSNETFADATLSSGNFILNNAPYGTSISDINYTNSTTATLDLAFDGTDFDDNITDFNITIDATELSGISDLTSNNLLITAVNDAESLEISGSATEGSEDVATISVTLTGGTFANTLTAGNWSLNNAPTGVSIEDISRTNSTEAVISLLGNRTVDYDSDITNLEVTANASEIDDISTTLTSTTNNFTFNATDVSGESISISGTISEGAEHGSVITATANNGTFAQIVSSSNWTLSGLPTGVSKGSINKTGPATVEITLSGNRTVDYDVSITNAQLTITDSEIDDYSGSDLSVSSGVTFSAIDDAESISIALLNGGAEADLDSEVAQLTISGGTFISGQINTTNITASGTAKTDANVSIESVSYVNSTTVNVNLAYDDTDFDTDKTLTIDVAAAAYDVGSVVISDDITLTATIEDAEITINDDGIIDEGSEDTEIITVSLSEDNFITTIDPANWTVNNLPDGVSKGDVIKTGDQTATIELSGNRTVDYDNSINVEVVITADELVTYGSSVSANSGVVLIANDDPETISIEDDVDGITEGAESGEEITVTLSGGTFADPLNSANWSLTNNPTGVSIGSINRGNATTATITLSGDRTTDYDSDITNLIVTANASEIDDRSSSLASDGTGATFSANDESVSIAHDGTGLTEANLSTATIDISLSNETFADATLSSGNFILNNAPSGTSISDVNYTNSTTATLDLAFDGTDFDDNITDFNITIDATELSGISNLTSNNLLITADDDVESLEISGSATEGSEDVATISVTLTGGTFANTLTAGNWSLNNAPTGVSIEDISRTNSTEAVISLLGNRTVDYDSDITNLEVTANASEIDDISTTLTSTTNNFTFNATDVSGESISISGTISEGAEHGSVITATANNGTFAQIVSSSNWTLSGLPTGVSKGSINKTGPATVEITLSGNRTIDYDVSITNAQLTITDSEIDDYSGSDLSVSSGVTFSAIDDAESISIALLNGGAEADLDSEVAQLTISGGTFISGQINTTNITASGTAKTDANVSIESVSYVNSTTVNVNLAYDDTDFDTDKTLTIDVAAAAYDVGSVVISDDITLTATIEDAEITINDDGIIDEGSEDTEIITVSLSEDNFITTIDPANWTVNNLPDGVSKGDVIKTGDQTATIELSGNRTVDYDNSINVEVVITADELVTYGSSVSANSGVVLIANDDSEELAISGSATEGNEDVASISVTLTGGTFADPLSSGNWQLNGAPAGVSIENISRTNSTEAVISLLGNTSVDYDSDITNLTVTANASEIDDISSSVISIINNFTFTAIDESLTINDPSIDESSIDGANITLTLTDETFEDGAFDNNNFTLNNAPSGTTVSGVSGSGSSATLTLAHDGTDYDVSYSNFSITVDGAELSSNGSLTSNEIVITATDETETLAISDDGTINEGSENGEVITITLSGGTFISPPLNAGSWSLSNAPDGVGIFEVNRTSATTAELILDGNRTVDYDANITNLTVTAPASDIDGNTTSLTSDGTGVTFFALNESITITESITHFGNIETGSSSLEQSYTIEGSELTDDVIITAPSGFEISETSGSGFGSSITLSPSSGSITSTTVYVRFSPASATTYSDNITHSSFGLTTENILVEGTGTEVGASSDISITEVADYYGNSGRDYIEILNTGNASVDIDGWTITERYTTGTSSRLMTLNNSTQKNTSANLVLEPNEYAIIVYSDWSGLKTDYGIANDVAIFSNSTLPIINGDERYQIDNGAKAVVDNFGDWDDASSFSTETDYAYERNSTGSDGELSSSWNVASSPSYGYTPAGENENPLPIELINFLASKEGDDIKISWITATEKDNKLFELMRSTDGVNFEDIHTEYGQGTSNTTSYYSYLDYNAPENSIIYYQLKQVDIDGGFSYSDIISLDNINKYKLEIRKAYFTDDELKLRIFNNSSAQFRVNIYSVDGKILMSKNISNPNELNTYKINTANISSQVLIIEVQNSRYREVIKLIK